MTVTTTRNVGKLYIAIFKCAPDGMGLGYNLNGGASL